MNRLDINKSNEFFTLIRLKLNNQNLINYLVAQFYRFGNINKSDNSLNPMNLKYFGKNTNTFRDRIKDY